jgi:hypothetical protein
MTAGWQTQTVVPQETKRTMYAGDVRVRTTDGSTHAFRGVWVSADSLGGWLAEPAGTERAFTLGAVETVQVRHRVAAQPEGRRSGEGSQSAVVVIVAALLGFGIIAANSLSCMMGGC